MSHFRPTALSWHLMVDLRNRVWFGRIEVERVMRFTIISFKYRIRIFCRVRLHQLESCWRRHQQPYELQHTFHIPSRKSKWFRLQLRHRKFTEFDSLCLSAYWLRYRLQICIELYFYLYSLSFYSNSGIGNCTPSFLIIISTPTFHPCQ